MIDLNEEAALLWLRLSADNRVLCPVSDLDASDDATESLRQAGLIEVCSWEDTACLSLTPLAAGRLKLRVTMARDGALVWSRTPAKQRRALRSKGYDFDASRYPDKRASDPSEFAAVNERILTYIKLHERNKKPRLTDADLAGKTLPRPSILLEGCQPWSSLWTGDCPVCGGLPLRASTYCLWCCRWGLDWLLTAIREAIADKEKAEKEAKAVEFKPKRAKRGKKRRQVA